MTEMRIDTSFKTRAAPRRSGGGGVVRRLTRLGDRAMDALGYRRESPDADEILASVKDEAGVAALQNWAVREPLERWTASMRDEADLGGLGRVAAHWDAVRMLRTLCRLEEEEQKAPSIRSEPIEAPIFITGMPRSGTTFLHTLMAQDPGVKAPLCWQGVAPYPPQRGRDKRREEVARQFAFFHRMVPDLASVHPVGPETPQECSELVAPIFRSLRFDTTHEVPSYRTWLDRTGHLLAYRYHKRFLQHLQHQSGQGRWVLKCPDHVFALNDAQKVYPDARFVFVHRDPLKVLPSVARLTELLREPFTRSLDRAAIGRHVTRDWLDGAGRMIAATREMRAAPGRLFHVHYADLRDRPIETVAAVYEHFGMEFAPVARARVEAEIARRPRGGYGRNVYRFEDHGIDPAIDRERFRSYTDFFGIAHEVRV